MEENILTDKAPACLLGLAIGEGMGLPADSLTPYEVLSRFGKIAGFFQGPSPILGDYGRGTACAGRIASDIVVSNKIPDPFPLSPSQDVAERTRLAFPAAAPVVLFLRNAKVAEPDIAKACKGIASGLGMNGEEGLAVCVYAYMLGEAAANSAALATPYDTYESDNSLLSRVIKMSAEAEKRGGFPARNAFPNAFCSPSANWDTCIGTSQDSSA
jgi:hypothetical protein